MARQLGHAVWIVVLIGGGTSASIGCAGWVGADFDDYGAASSSTSETVPPEASDDGGTSEPAPKDAAAKPDTSAPTKKCVGTATTCATYATDMTSCQAQEGCTWVPPACSGQATGCATFDPNVCYAKQPACTYDFNARQCHPHPSWCKTTDAATCGARAGCSWTGGCAGTAATCDSLAASACTAQRGCALVTK